MPLGKGTRPFIIDRTTMNMQDPQQQSPAASYQKAVSNFLRLAQEEAEIVHEAGASHLLQHGARTPRAYVLLHGTTNSPTQWLEFGRMLFDLGHNVLIPRAPYHGLRSRRVGELAQLTPSDLRSYTNEAVDIGCGLGDELALIGASGGATIATWAAQNRREIDRTLLVVPFFGFYGLPDRFSFQLMNLLGRLPDLALTRPGELRRPWAYRGQSSHGIVAYLSLAGDVLDGARQGIAPAGKMIIITTSGDKLANNGTTARLAKMWQHSGVEVVQYDFARDLQVAHNSVDPAADPLKRQLVYQKMLALLDEQT